MKLPLLELQKAIFQRLNKNISCEVYDNVDVFNNEDGHIQFPYARLGDNTIVDDGTKTDDRTNVTFSINVFSRHARQTEIKQVVNEIVEQITKSPLELESFIITNSKVDFLHLYQEFQDVQSNIKKVITQCAIMVFRFKILEK